MNKNVNILELDENNLNNDNFKIDDPSLFEENCFYKIMMDGKVLKNGGLYRYVGKKNLTKDNNSNGMEGIFYYFLLNNKTEYLGETWISLYTFEKVE
jgi:hypothetical protein